ncbi:hypothetical protein [Bacillus sp. ISL-7]|uniref:hypothetical protein n=1 Tax=Bacillus sp. ISL-7 TaxID=2819136 RepID=UPI001BEA00DE|nr:hypothetical protein [Bacillus sp. ISL-7]MBT2738929.1 hypothetical protein [Bacillus sp. ISL-7]
MVVRNKMLSLRMVQVTIKGQNKVFKLSDTLTINLVQTIEFWLVEDGKVAEIRLDDTSID